ncbi:hypothetical protein HK105_207266 [Polyrhizophydium stewartii]|uniref:Dienelactone hydrolase domain-containing protein n=1 Tax=Polyrhizophydium stewartii TaxID=2732419 RepID=A0ABR4N1A6_9FUNG
MFARTLTRTPAAATAALAALARTPAARGLHLKSLPFAVHKFTPHATLRHTLNAADAVDTPTPAVVVIQEWWGVDEQVRAHAQRIANCTGAVALVPDLYKGKVALDEAEAAHLMNGLDWKQALEDLASLVAVLRDAGHERRKVASLGFCMGGAMSLALGARMQQVASAAPLNACVAFYGIPPAGLIDISQLPVRTPVQAHFGENDDHKGFSDAASARALEARWAKAIKEHGGMHAHGLHSLEERVFVHPGVGHAFMNEVRKRSDFDSALVTRTWQQVFDFLTEHLKTV